jgi:polar amino acid transport system substrate-binding protein
VQGKDPADCFNQVLSGKVDAATVNLFLGANLILEMGLRNKILPLEKPLSEEGLHVVISKRHWRGTTHLYRVNAGLQKLKDDGRYQEIVSRHMELFRAQLQ